MQGDPPELGALPDDIHTVHIGVVAVRVLLKGSLCHQLPGMSAGEGVITGGVDHVIRVVRH